MTDSMQQAIGIKYVETIVNSGNYDELIAYHIPTDTWYACVAGGIRGDIVDYVRIDSHVGLEDFRIFKHDEQNKTLIYEIIGLSVDLT